MKRQFFLICLFGITFNKEKYGPGDTLVATVKITDPNRNPINKLKFNASFSTDKYYRESDKAQTNQEGESLIRFTLHDSITSQPRFKVTTKQNTDKASVTKDVNIPYQDPYSELQFLAEGGTFIEGHEQRIGFNATNSKCEKATHYIRNNGFHKTQTTKCSFPLRSAA